MLTEFSVQRLNVIATSTPSPPNDSFAASNASGFTEFYCFGTIPDPDSSLFWMWRGAEINSSYVPYPWSERIHEEEVQVDQNCQYWRGNTLRHVWTGYDNVLHLRCSLSRDGNGDSAVCSKFQGSMITRINDFSVDQSYRFEHNQKITDDDEISGIDSWTLICQ